MKELETKMKKEWRNVNKRARDGAIEQREEQRPKRGNVGDANGRKVEDALQDQ